MASAWLYTSTDVVSLRQLISQKQDDADHADRTISEIIADVEKANTLQGLLKLREELRKKKSWLEASTARLDRIAGHGVPTPGQHTNTTGEEPIDIANLRDEVSSYTPPSRDLVIELARSRDCFLKIWDVLQRYRPAPDRVTSAVPGEYQINIQTAGNVHVTQTPVVEIVVRSDEDFGQPNDSPSPRGTTDIKRVKRVVVSSECYTVNLNVGPVCVNQITGSNIMRAVEDMLITKIDWPRELVRAQELKAEEQRLAFQFEREKCRGQQALDEAQKKAETRLENLYRKHEAERRRDQETVKTFVMKLKGERDVLLEAVMKNLRDQTPLNDVIRQLFEQFDVRLLGVDSGLRFLMDTPAEEWDRVLLQQADIQRILGQTLLPETQEVTFTAVNPVEPEADMYLRLGQPLDTDVMADCVHRNGHDELTSRAESSEGVLLDSRSTARHVLAFTARHHDDWTDPWITAIIATDDTRLVMVDFENEKIKVIDVTTVPHNVRSVKLAKTPWALALLHDGLVAVSFLSRKIYLVDVSDDPTVVSRVQTDRKYRGICRGTDPDTLIVSCSKDTDGPTRVDVITRKGYVLRTVTQFTEVTDLEYPDYLCLDGQHVIVSDCLASALFRVELSTGRVAQTLTHTDMKWPRQVATDAEGNIFTACSKTDCVMKVIVSEGTWRRLVEGGQHGDQTCSRPRGICILGSRLVVAWRKDNVVVYDLA